MKRRNHYHSTTRMLLAGSVILLSLTHPGQPLQAQIAGGTLSPHQVEKYALPLVQPPAMPKSPGSNKNKDKYRIAVRQFEQQILPPSHPMTTVWSYGSVDHPDTFNYPAFTIEAAADKIVQVLWINDLVDAEGNYLPHLLPIDQTLHWANPPGGRAMRDQRGFDPSAYTGPVPIVTHVHGAHTAEDSDGYPEAWYLPAANNIPQGYATTGTFFDYFNKKYHHGWTAGTASFQYPNDQPAATLWYHDHTLGMTRANVYAGPAGFYLIRGGEYDLDLGYVAPGIGDDPFATGYTEIPIAIQDRSFNADGSLFYPDNRAFFEGLDPADLQIPFFPDEACDGLLSDIAPIWNPEFFGNMMVANGRTWPYLDVEQRRYRFRFLNGCNSRFLVLKLTTAPRTNNAHFNVAEASFWQIGAEQGFLPGAVELDSLLIGPAERADVIVDFQEFEVGDVVYLVNDGPDAPFGEITTEDLADWSSTGQVMAFRVNPPTGPDMTTPPDQLTALPLPPPLEEAEVTRILSLNEEDSHSVRVTESDGMVFLDCDNGDPFGPAAALLGTFQPDMDDKWSGTTSELLWHDPITENPQLGHTETWEIYNFTADAHPIHIHLVKFEVINREDEEGNVYGSEPWETGFKDTVIAYPGEITRVKMVFDLPGFYVWHCHILEHEDNEMMRPLHVGPVPSKAPTQ